MSKVINSAAGTTYYGTNGSALSGQPNNNSTRFAGGETSSIPEENSSTEYFKAVTYLSEDAFYTVSSIQEYNESGNLRFIAQGNFGRYHVYPGDYFEGIDQPGVLIPVLASDLTNNVTIDWQYDDRDDLYSDASGPVGTIYPKNIVDSARDGQFTIIGSSTRLADLPNTALQSGAITKPRAVNGREAVRTTRTTTAIRAGHWNEYDGKFSTAPTVADDTSDFNLDSDKAILNGSRVTYTNGGDSTYV